MPLRTDLLDPISGDNPAGEDLRYAPIYDEIKQARFEEDDLPQGDWDRDRKLADHAAVIRLAEETLAKETKDVQLAAWLTEALLHEQGFGGLRDGLDLLRGLLENFWDHAYPEIEDGDLDFRAMPLSWVGGYLEVPVKSVPLNAAGHTYIDYTEAQKLGTEEEAETAEEQADRQAAIEEGTVPPEDFDASFDKTPKSFYKELLTDIDGALEATRELDEFGNEKFGHAAPSYRKLREATEEVRRIAARLLKEKLERDPDPAGEESFDLEPGPDATGADGGISPDPTSRVDAARRIASVARYLRHETPTDPSPYLLLRGFRWGELLGEEAEPDPRLLEAPATPIRTRLRGLLLDAKWDELLDACEDVMATPHGRGWLDLQRYTLTACEGLGSEYDLVANAIRGALGRLLRDVPSLPSLVLMDDTPTANRETMAWLAEAGLAEAAADAPAAPAPSRASSQTPSAVVSRATTMAGRGETEEAVGLLMNEISRATSERSRFLLQSAAARIMVDSKMDPVARPMLEEMTAAIERHQLEDWEDGPVVAQPLALLYTCVRRSEGEHAGQEIYQTVCRLDPMLGMRVASQLDEEASASSSAEQHDE